MKMLKDLSSTTEVAARATAVMRNLTDRNWCISTAESCTGGLVAALFTDIEGCSHAFDRGFVVYSEEAKVALLGVDPKLLEEKGAVSKEVALAMAEGAVMRSNADIAVAVTGFAGEADTEDKAGLVHMALCRRGGSTVHQAKNWGAQERDKVRQLSLLALLEMLEGALGRKP
ncbi:MAG: CinA family protein [Sulfitobacter sp. SK025]|nr:MAG: CinA family protein [Sulfitobacter sp. SK025]